MHFGALLVAAAAGIALASDYDDLCTVRDRRRVDMATFTTPQNLDLVATWVNDQKDDGTWDDVNYASGCEAQKANWPIQQHWIRVNAILAAWSGLYPEDVNQKERCVVSNTDRGTLFESAVAGMIYWFDNDFDKDDCMSHGGDDNKECPCDTPGLWNQNWFSNVLLIPQLVGTACLLIQPGTITQNITDGCTRIMQRGWDQRNDDSMQSKLTGANAVQLGQNAVSLASFIGDTVMLYDAMDMTLSGLVVVGPSPQDGIHFDGSFTQHSGLLYNGNYGKDLINAFVQLESETLWTNYGANSTYQEAFTTLMGGSEWMVFLDSETGQLHWDYNVIGRFVAFATEDQQASADVNINMAKLSDAVANFANLDVMYDVMDRMGSNFSKPLHGNRAFPASDYMVHRGEGFVLGNKLLSTRTNSTECTNSANIDGYHMGHGTLFAYGSGHEYVDIMGQWDWNLIPGTTVLLGEPDVIDVECANVAQSGTRTAVGVVSDGTLGMSMMDYHDEVADLSFRKSWAFFGDRVVVTVTKVETGSDKPLITVLDNRRSADSKVPVVDGAATHNAEQNAKSVFYDNKGYVANTEFELTMEDVWREGNWSVISTSTQGVQSAPIWSAYTVTPKDFFSYTFFPNTDLDTVLAEADAPSTEIFDDDHLHHGVKFGDNYAVAFFETGTAWYKGENYSIAIGSSDPALVLAHDNGSDEVQLSVSDPTQSLDKLVITITRCNSRYCKSGNVDIELPKTGETVSGSVSYDLSS